MIANIDLVKLQASLNYLAMHELKDYCKHLNLITKGKKITLILRIIHFLKTGEKTEVASYPAISCTNSKSHTPHVLHPNNLILKGAYKNDLKTRLFFKKLIGDYFHFTAFGVDWLEAQWLHGKPPTYQEFADMWQKEYLLRKTNGSTPKKEWAYISFVKQYLHDNPAANSKELLKQWQLERDKHKKWVAIFFSNYLSSYF